MGGTSSDEEEYDEYEEGSSTPSIALELSASLLAALPLLLRLPPPPSSPRLPLLPLPTRPPLLLLMLLLLRAPPPLLRRRTPFPPLRPGGPKRFSTEAADRRGSRVEGGGCPTNGFVRSPNK